MNKLKILVTIFAVAIITLGIYSCAKDESKNEQNHEFTTENRNALPSVINGMLHFDTYSDFETYIANLEALENDTNQVKTAYIQLGVDLTQEFLPNLSDYPVSLRMEQQLTGFTSARKAEETVINNALNNGDDSVFSIVSDPFFKSAINTDNSVHIGTRIFKFYNNDGLAIILNNDWSTYNTINLLNYSNLRQAGNLIVTNNDPKSWSKLYNLNSDGKLTTEKEYVPPTIVNPESPLACDFSDKIVVTNLANSQIRFELPGQGYDFYLWYFGTGQQGAGNPLVVDCSKIGNSGSVTLEGWVWDSTVPSGKRMICRGTVQYFCNCGEKKEKKKTEEWTNAGGSGKKIRIEAVIWVKDGEIGCKSKHFGKGWVGWVPLNYIYNTNGIFANIVGTFKREVTPENCIIINQPFNEKQHPGGNNASWQNIISQPGKNFVDSGNLSSGHRIRLKTGGTFFGFGVDRPRLILD